jgi:hypothetical protein
VFVSRGTCEVAGIPGVQTPGVVLPTVPVELPVPVVLTTPVDPVPVDTVPVDPVPVELPDPPPEPVEPVGLPPVIFPVQPATSAPVQPAASPATMTMRLLQLNIALTSAVVVTDARTDRGHSFETFRHVLRRPS